MIFRFSPAPLLPCLVCLLLAFGGAWGACRESESYTFARGDLITACGCNSSNLCEGEYIKWWGEVPANGYRKNCTQASCNSDGYNYCGLQSKEGGGTCIGQKLKYQCVGVVCDTQEEADSAQCVNGGKTWNGSFCASADSMGYACITFTKNTSWGGSYTAHSIYRLNYTQRTEELIEEAGGSCDERGYCKNLGTNGYATLGTAGRSCFENDSGAMSEDFGDGESSSSSSSSSFDWGSSSSVSCELTGKFFNTCYFECSNGAITACNGNDGNCDDVEGCEIQDWKSSGSSGGSSSGSGSGSGSGSSSASAGDSSGTGESGQIDYTGKLNEILDTLHNGNMNQLGANSQLAQISRQLDNMNTNIVGIGSGGLTKGQYDNGVSQIIEAENGTRVSVDALGNVIDVAFRNSDSLSALGWQKIDYWRELDSVESVKRDSSDSLRNAYVMRIDSVLSDTSKSEIDTSGISYVSDGDSTEYFSADSTQINLPIDEEIKARVDSVLSGIDTSSLDSAGWAQIESELGFDEDSLYNLLGKMNDSLTGVGMDLADSAVTVWKKELYAPFDSLLNRVLPAGSNSCPEQCYSFKVDIPIIGDVLIKSDMDFGEWLCRNDFLNWSNGVGILGIIKIGLRFISAFLAVFIVFRFMSKEL